jgi:hypothetical protein
MKSFKQKQVENNAKNAVKHVKPARFLIVNNAKVGSTKRG